MFTPSEKLPLLTMAIFSAAFSSSASCSGVKPVEPMTRAGPPISADCWARATEASGV